ncbi:hypothetical protein ElyMa_006799500 [Elysia marginata]|uniref:Caspase recruitment domain-containing protein n=1 Tax=Elysia marginata TaxID=1093978 RepID=A0AAV4J3M1_9GAST|nr:hypothetical protein ElyMa_006799500 [Elysia marginata]
MGFETDERMRRYVNNNRQLFLNSLPTELFMEEFPDLLTYSRQQIRCRLRTDSPWSANSLLLDCITRQEDFCQKFIKFCKERKQCLELARALHKQLNNGNRDRRKRPKTDGSASSARNMGQANSDSQRRSDRVQKNITQDDSAQSQAAQSQTTQSQAAQSQAAQSQAVGAELSSSSSSSTSSFFLDSVDIEDSDKEEEQHCINELKGCFLSEHGLGDELNIPPTSSNNARAPGTGAALPRFSGVQCEEDLEAFLKQAPSPDALSRMNRNSSHALPDPQQTFRKSVVQSEQKFLNPKSKQKITYFEVSPCDVLGMSSDTQGLKDKRDSTELSSAVTEEAGTLPFQQVDVDEHCQEARADPSTVSEGFDSLGNNLNQTRSFQPGDSDVTYASEPTGGSGECQELQSSENVSMESRKVSETETETETENDSDAEPAQDEENQNENPPRNQELGSIFFFPIRVVAVAVGGVGALLRAPLNYLNFFRNP